MIARQQLQIEKLTRQLYGQNSERTVRLLDQMELAFEELGPWRAKPAQHRQASTTQP